MSSDNFQAYCAVNTKFAESTLQALRKILDDLDREGKTDVTPIIWIHDYQLLTAATYIRHVSKNGELNPLANTYKIYLILHINLKKKEDLMVSLNNFLFFIRRNVNRKIYDVV